MPSRREKQRYFTHHLLVFSFERNLYVQSDIDVMTTKTNKKREEIESKSNEQLDKAKQQQQVEAERRRRRRRRENRRFGLFNELYRAVVVS